MVFVLPCYSTKAAKWFTAAAKLSSDGPLKVYDSVFMSITEEVEISFI